MVVFSKAEAWSGVVSTPAHGRWQDPILAKRNPSELEPLGPGVAQLPSGPAGKKARKAEREVRSWPTSTGDGSVAQAGVRSLSYSAYSPVFELSPNLKLPAPHTHPDTWACEWFGAGSYPDRGRGAEKAVRTPQLECPVDCLTNSFKETN